MANLRKVTDLENRLDVHADGDGTFTGIDIETDVFLGIVEETRKMNAWLKRWAGLSDALIPRRLVAVTTPNTPLLMDFGGAPAGRAWDIRVVSVSPINPFSTNPLVTTTTQANQEGTGAASPIVLTVPAVAGKTNQISGIMVSGTGATAGSTIQITITGLQGGTKTIDYVVPAGAGVAAPTLEESYNPPLVASGPNVAIVMTVPSFGAGNLASAASLYAQQVSTSGGADNAYLAIGSPGGQPPYPFADLINVVQPIPFTISQGSVRWICRQQDHLYVVAGSANLTNGATACIVEVPDIPEILALL